MPVLNDRGEVRAAGGVVLRGGDGAEGGDGAGGPLEVLVVHRPKYDDWTLPKGKLERGETDEECARREVLEETGLVCELVRELPVQRYRSDRAPDGKVVRYWVMRPVGGELSFTAEVDSAQWVPVDEAAAVLSYERDALVVASARA